MEKISTGRALEIFLFLLSIFSLSEHQLKHSSVFEDIKILDFSDLYTFDCPATWRSVTSSSEV